MLQFEYYSHPSACPSDHESTLHMTLRVEQPTSETHKPHWTSLIVLWSASVQIPYVFICNWKRQRFGILCQCQIKYTKDSKEHTGQDELLAAWNRITSSASSKNFHSELLFLEFEYNTLVNCQLARNNCHAQRPTLQVNYWVQVSREDWIFSKTAARKYQCNSRAGTTPTNSLPETVCQQHFFFKLK